MASSLSDLNAWTRAVWDHLIQTGEALSAHQITRQWGDYPTVYHSASEMLNMACFHVQGCDHTVTLAAQAGQLELNVMMPIIAHNLFEMMHVLTGAINAFTTRCVVGVTANREKAEGWLAKNAILVTALNPVIGYLNGAAVAKEAMATGKTIKEVVVEKGLLAADQVDALIDAGAKDVIIAATHAVLSGPAIDRLKKSRVSEVVVTNTLPIAEESRFDNLTVLSIAPLLARAIKEVFEDGSVTSLFDGHS